MGKTYKKYNKESWEEIPSKFKKFQKRSRRAKEKEALREGREAPTFKKSDEWDWF